MQVLGTPDPATWPGLAELPDYGKICFPDSQPVPLEMLVPGPPEALGLLRGLVTLDPARRMPADQASQ
jgi:hypothetical protein